MIMIPVNNQRNLSIELGVAITTSNMGEGHVRALPMFCRSPREETRTGLDFKRLLACGANTAQVFTSLKKK